MKIVTAGLLLLSLLAGGARAATSANPTNATYTLNAVFTNNPQFQVAYAIGLPKPGSNVFLPGENGFVATDGAGRIDGAQQLTILSPVPTYDVGAYEADVTGTITSTRSNPVIRMTIKGTGFAQDWAGLTPASSSFSMTFQTSNRAEMDWQTNVLTLTNPVVVISVGADGVTNATFTRPLSATVVNSGFQTALVQFHSSQVVANYAAGGTNFTSVLDSIQTTNVSFGLTVATNTSGLLSAPNSTNTFPSVAIAQQSTDNLTNYVYGLDITNLAAYLASFNVSNETVVQVLAALATNSVAGNTNIGGTVTFSNAFESIVGTLKGSINAGGKSRRINDTATLETEHTSYELLPAATNGMQVVIARETAPGLLAVTRAGFSCGVIQYARTLRMPSPTGGGTINPSASDSYSGYGSLRVYSKYTSWVANLRGLGWSRSSYLNFIGTNGVVITGYQYNPTNSVVQNITNLAVTPPLVVSVTNNTGTLLVTNVDFHYPLAVSGTNATDVRFSAGVLVLTPPLVTNTVPNGIRTIQVTSGRQLGQVLPLTSGTNQDAAFPPLNSNP